MGSIVPTKLRGAHAAGAAHAAEVERREALREAEAKASKLFDEVVSSGLLRAGLRESTLSRQVQALAAEMYGVKRFWHKRIVRSGPNTLHPYRENPPDRVIAEDDILFLDFGPVFNEWEADFGRTYVLGDDPEKHRLATSLDGVWRGGKEFFDSHPDITGRELYEYIVDAVAGLGWEFPAHHAGHLIGEFPHERLQSNRLDSYIAPQNVAPMRKVDPQGRRCHWILEVHMVDRKLQIGGFYEQLLTLS